MNTDFFYYLYDTLILLGAPKSIADMVRKPEIITESHIDELRNFNCQQIDKTKDKLMNINKIKVRTIGK